MSKLWWKIGSFIVEVGMFLCLWWGLAYPTQGHALIALGSVAVAMGYQAIRRKRLH